MGELLVDQSSFLDSPIEEAFFRGRKLYIKRDDLLAIAGYRQAFNGNKARKLYGYLCNDFPNVSNIISYGSAQSNMLFSLSVLARDKEALYIPEGGLNEKSEFGIKLLADELINWVENENITNPKLMLPSGTGTTAFYLQKHLPFEVLTCACVGGGEYLRKQFLDLGGDNCPRSSTFHETTL